MSKRPHMGLRVQRDAALHALGLDPALVEWHHEPPLAIRSYDDETGTYAPDANDPRHIVPMAKQAHKDRYGADRSAIDKTARNESKWRRFCAQIAAKAGLDDKPRDVKKHRRIPSRPFQKQRRLMRRTTERRGND